MDLSSIQCDLVKRDPKLQHLFDNVVVDWNTIIKPVYVALIGAIIGQKIKYTQARTIRGNLFRQFGPNYSYQDLDIVNEQLLVRLGLSLTNIAIITRVNDYLREGNPLETVEDVRKLICIKGIGEWTVNTTLLCAFPLNCIEEVFPYADVFIRDRVKKLYNLSKRPTIKEMKKISLNWPPYQSIVCWYFWRWFP